MADEQHARVNLEAERAVLGALLTHADAHALVAPLLKGDDFAAPKHRLIYRAILHCAQNDKRPTPVIVAEALRAARVANVVGTTADLEALIYAAATTTLADAETHARLVAQLAQARRIEAVAQRTIARSRDASVSIADLVSLTSQELLNASRGLDEKPASSMADLANGFWDRVNARRSVFRDGRCAGVSSGLTDLDALTGGWEGGQLIVIAARPAMGKTSLAGLAALSAARENTGPVLFFSLEMPVHELFWRFVAMESNSDVRKLRDGSLDDVRDAATLERMESSRSKLARLRIAIDGRSGLTLDDIRASAKREHTQESLGAIVIDYLQLMKGDASAQSREQEVAGITKGLKTLAKELNVPIIILSQLNRKCEERADKRPLLSDLRESGSVEQDADVVIFIYRDEVYRKETEDKGIAEIILAKQRNGPTDTIRARWVAPSTRFEDLDTGTRDAWQSAPVESQQPQSVVSDAEFPFSSGSTMQ